MQIGNYQVKLLDAGRFRLDGGAMFGVVPRTLWERQKPGDERNRIQMCTNLLLIEGEKRKILVDTGIGDSFDDKLNDIYGVDHSRYSLASALQQAGIKPEQITDVILTHLHFDHAGGSTFRDRNGTVRATFPNAKYYLQGRQFGWAMQPSEKDRASFFQQHFIPLQENNQLILLEDGSELFPGIEVIPVEGHTVGQQMVLIHDDRQPLLFAGDLLPTSAHVSIPWVMAYDLYPLTTIEEKKHFLKRAVDQQWIIVFEHDPVIPAATVALTEKGYRLQDKIDLV
ncbi:MAG: MBL fold metallo-hydrolase [Calditrichaeota bacterium]|nr:MBL fold metallo-hydrolase [Calditrichota bacterium]MCB0305834.1 MBL fold metallo-hydrolase [Calditrichota bacterium]MCB0313991.1 MBL fold metallo-hydrolase [Calditrichota bacterium]